MSSWTHFDTVVAGLSTTTGLAITATAAAVKAYKRLKPIAELTGIAGALKQIVEDHHGVPDRPGVPGRLGIMPAIAEVREDVTEMRTDLGDVKKDVKRLDDGQKHTHRQNEAQTRRLAVVERTIQARPEPG